MRMRPGLRLAVLALTLGWAAKPAAAQQFLPQNFAGWQAIPGSDQIIPLSNTLDSTPDRALQYSWHRLSGETRQYQRNGETLTVTLTQLADPSDAYSEYSFERPVPAGDFRPTPHSSVGADQAMVLVGNMLVSVTGQNLPAAAQDFVALGAAIRPHASSIPYPSLWQYMPSGSLVPNSDRYTLAPAELTAALVRPDILAESASPPAPSIPWPSVDWLGFADDAEAEVARYLLAGRTVTMVLASYPTQQLAAEHVANFSKWYQVNPADAVARAASGRRPPIFVKRYSSLVGIVAGPVDAAEAGRLLRQVRYQTVVTWNEPGFKFDELTMPQYIVGIIYGTISIILMTLVAGIALGLIRVSVKHYFPGVVFDRRRSVEILQLGLTSKPIDSNDFYGP